MIRTSALAVHVASWVTIAGAVVTGAVLVSRASTAAFSASATNSANGWTTGTVALALDDSGTAMFSASGLKPGSSGTRCISVTSTGTLPSAVKLYGTNASTTNSLSSYINLTVTLGSGGSFGSCTGFTPDATNPTVYASGTLANFASTATNYATGLGVWAPSGSTSESRTYQVSYSVSSAIPNSAQGGSAAIGFTWEEQNS